ncbi:MAG: hypothetical protein ACK2TV_02885, partial [Anaerolineales bacterium]
MRPPLRVHVLYEHTVHPHSSSFIRLLQPLTHPLLNRHIDVSYGIMYGGLDTDLIIIDRYWSPHKINLDIAKDIVNEIRIAGARFIYALDDNFFDIPSDRSNSPTREQLTAVKYFLRTADMVWVTTPYLEESFENFTKKIKILPNGLDERLLIRRAPKIAGS